MADPLYGSTGFYSCTKYYKSAVYSSLNKYLISHKDRCRPEEAHLASKSEHLNLGVNYQHVGRSNEVRNFGEVLLHVGFFWEACCAQAGCEASPLLSISSDVMQQFIDMSDTVIYN